MQKEHFGSRERDAMLEGGIWGVFFDAFSSKKAETQILWNHDRQSCSEDFQCCSFTGKEKDEETGFGYFGARYMDHELMTGWLSVDPMADKYPSISPYAYCAWNPVKLVDPNGEDVWWPDEDGNWVAEKGDNARTLARCSGITIETAMELLRSNGYSTTENVPEGTKIQMNNLYVEAINDAKNGRVRTISRKEMNALIKSMDATDYSDWKKKWKADKENTYNCYGAAISGSHGESIRGGIGIERTDSFETIIQRFYSQIEMENAIPGQTVIVFKNSEGETKHGAIFYGCDNSGTQYAFSKNGWFYPPIVTTVESLEKTYGNVSGYYNLNKNCE